jgi:hypothetical protein
MKDQKIFKAASNPYFIPIRQLHICLCSRETVTLKTDKTGIPENSVD